MVAAEGPPSYKLHFPWNLNDLNDMTAALDSRQQNPLSSFPNPYAAFPVRSLSVKPGSKIDQTNGVYMFQNLPSRVASPRPTPDSFIKGSQNNALCDQFGVKATPNNVSSSCQKQFVIFDRSGDETRMIVSPFLSLMQNQIALAKTSSDAYNVRDEIVEETRTGKVSPGKLFTQEKMDESTIFGEEIEMHEDTEEINALLYSDDSDDDDYDSDSEDDEVMSTGHSPYKVRGDYDKHGETPETADEAASSDASNKRRKLVDGGYKKSSSVHPASSMKLMSSSGHNNDAESSCGIHENPSPDMDSVSSTWRKKVKIRETLKLLEQMVPGLHGQNPLSIIDGAIDYLASLRHKAETLGVPYSQAQATFPE